MRQAFFIFLQVLFLPLNILGYFLFVLSLINRVRISGVDIPMNVASPLYIKWYMHKIGIRKDDASVKLSETLSDFMPSKAKLIAVPTIIASKISGYKPVEFAYPKADNEKTTNWTSARLEFVDAAIERNLATTEQVVIIAAGLETRSFNMFQNRNIPVFEIDTTAMLHQKKEAMKVAGLTGEGIEFVEVDKAEEWADRLIRKGFDKEKKTLFLMEGSTYYLSEVEIFVTMKNLRELSAKGSTLLFDFISKHVFCLPPVLTMQDIEMHHPFWKHDLTFGLKIDENPEEAINKLLRVGGFQLQSYRLFGPRNDKFAGAVEARID